MEVLLTAIHSQITVSVPVGLGPRFGALQLSCAIVVFSSNGSFRRNGLQAIRIAEPGYHPMHSVLIQGVFESVFQLYARGSFSHIIIFAR